MTRRTPATSPGGPAALRSDVAVSDGKRSWHVTCLERDGYQYVVTAAVTSWFANPKTTVDAVLDSWAWA